ncbi:MAG: hypothetical protein ABI538_03400 [Pseudoxanthomonas sp.]
MNHKLFTTMSGLSISSALLVVGLLAFGGQATRLPRVIDDGLLVDAIETGALQATEEVVVPRERKQRRNRTPLSMPYFSFAQSLRPGS